MYILCMHAPIGIYINIYPGTARYMYVYSAAPCSFCMHVPLLGVPSPNETTGQNNLGLGNTDASEWLSSTNHIVFTIGLM